MITRELMRARRHPHYVSTMRARLSSARAAAGNRLTDGDRQWFLRQGILQGLRELGFDVILRDGDIGFYDEDTDTGLTQPAI